jgi:hypothetical protein
MGKTYEDQTALRIRLTVGQDITGATTVKIKYRKPDGTEGSWDATIEDAVNGIIYYDITGSDEIDKGLYTFWAFITFNDGRSAPGEPLTRFFYSEGS